MKDTETITAKQAAILLVFAVRRWAEGSGIRITASLEPNGDVKVTWGTHQWFVVGVKSVVDEREYRLLFDHEE